MMFYHGKYGAIALCMVRVIYTWWSSIDHPGCLSIVHTDLKHMAIKMKKTSGSYISKNISRLLYIVIYFSNFLVVGKELIYKNK